MIKYDTRESEAAAGLGDLAESLRDYRQRRDEPVGVISISRKTEQEPITWRVEGAFRSGTEFEAALDRLAHRLGGSVNSEQLRLEFPDRPSRKYIPVPAGDIPSGEATQGEAGRPIVLFEIDAHTRLPYLIGVFQNNDEYPGQRGKLEEIFHAEEPVEREPWQQQVELIKVPVGPYRSELEA